MVRARSVNHDGLHDVQRLLSNRFGIESKLYLHGKPKFRTWSQSYDLDIFRGNDLITFADEIGFNHPEKQARLKLVVMIAKSRTRRK